MESLVLVVMLGVVAIASMLVSYRHGKDDGFDEGFSAGSNAEWVVWKPIVEDKNALIRSLQELREQLEAKLVASGKREKTASAAADAIWKMASMLDGQLQAVRNWIAGLPVPEPWMCLWCNAPITGGKEAALKHVQECEQNPLVQKVKALSADTRLDDIQNRLDTAVEELQKLAAQEEEDDWEDDWDDHEPDDEEMSEEEFAETREV